jgi:hypothetical protein
MVNERSTKVASKLMSQKSSSSQGRRLKLRASPIFQSSLVVIPALHHLAMSGKTERHTGFLLPVMGQMAVSAPVQVDSFYRQAVALAFGVRSIAGLESILLTGLNNALVANDRDGALAGLSALKYLPSQSRSRTRPVVLVDVTSSLITVLSMAEFEVARSRLVHQAAGSLFGIGIGVSVRSLG